MCMLPFDTSLEPPPQRGDRARSDAQASLPSKMSDRACSESCTGRTAAGGKKLAQNVWLKSSASL